MKTRVIPAIAAVVSFIAVSAEADPIHHKIAHLRHEIIALNASLITAMSQAENSIGGDVERLHASIVAAQLETVDTAAAYREAKSLIDDLYVLRQHAITDLTLPSDYTPPDVASTVQASVTTELELVLASTYGDLASFQRSLVETEVATLDLQKKIGSLDGLQIGEGLETMVTNNISAGFEYEANRYSQFSELTNSNLSALSSALASMARNLQE